MAHSALVPGNGTPRAGRRPGLWIAPFLASPSSRVATEHPDWFASHASGRRLVGNVNEHWGGAVHVLDTTHPDVLAHLERLARDLVDLGFTYLKLDFTYAPGIAGAYADPSIFERDGRWWLLCCGNPCGHDMLNLFSAPTLEASWHEHAIRPLIENDNRRARPAGRVTISEGQLIRFAQDCRPQYGTGVRAFLLLELTTTSYAERELAPNPILGPGRETWNDLGMHHLDPRQLPDGSWLACVDGCAPLTGP